MRSDVVITRIQRFIASGVLVTGGHIVLAASLIRLLFLAPPLANGIAFAGATIFSYVINTRWTFSRSLHGRSLVRFVLVSIIGLFLAVTISGLADLYGLHYWFGIGGVICVVTPLSFALHSYWTYR